jgi:methylglutaconyl-CoA hydratase
VHEVTSDLDEAVERVVAALVAGGPEAVRAAKRLARDRPDGLDTARIAAARRTSPEGQEGLRAFLEKRDPSWKSSS